MEFLTIFITIIISFLSSGGLILDRVLANLIRSRTESVEELEVRVDNVPSYQILQGKAKRIRIASRGLEPIEQVRIAVLELETDPIELDLEQLQGGDGQNFRQALRKPLQGGIRLVLSQQDLNKALQSEQIQSYLPKLISNSETESYQLINPRLELKGDNRVAIALQVKLLKRDREETLDITLELGLEVEQGHQIKIVDPMGTLNGRKLSRKLLQGFADNINSQLDFRTLEKDGITLRLLKLDINDNEINMAAFVRIAKDYSSN
jgi:hypothetical protein